MNAALVAAGVAERAPDELHRFLGPPLRATFARVVATRTPELIKIVGEPGIGKSHLAAELRAIAADGGRLLTGRCPAYGEGITYWPLREIVLQAKGDRSIDNCKIAIQDSAARRNANLLHVNSCAARASNSRTSSSLVWEKSS